MLAPMGLQGVVRCPWCLAGDTIWVSNHQGAQTGDCVSRGEKYGEPQCNNSPPLTRYQAIRGTEEAGVIWPHGA